jgi:hypothetical protein
MPEEAAVISSSNPIPKVLITGVLGVFSAAGILSCGSDLKPTEPESSATAELTELEGDGLSLGAGEPSGHRGFFPLDIGNRWTYQTQYFTLVISDSCDILTDSVTVCAGWGSIGWGGERRELIGTEELFGREYMIEQWTSWPQIIWDGDTARSWIRYRQDRAGLYEADVPLGQRPGTVGTLAAVDHESVRPPGQRLSADLEKNGAHLTPAQAAAYDVAMERIQRKLEVVAVAQAWHGHSPRSFGGRRGGALDSELARLKYPLHPGQNWTIRQDPLFTSQVIGHDVLELPAGKLGGWRIQIESGLFDPDDRVYIWYGRAGFLRLSVSLQSVAVDEWGNRIGTAFYQESSELESFELVRP